MGFHTLRDQNEILSEQIETLKAELSFQTEARAEAEVELQHALKEMTLLNHELQEIVNKYQKSCEDMKVAVRVSFAPFLGKKSNRVVSPY